MHSSTTLDSTGHFVTVPYKRTHIVGHCKCTLTTTVRTIYSLCSSIIYIHITYNVIYIIHVISLSFAALAMLIACVFLAVNALSALCNVFFKYGFTEDGLACPVTDIICAIPT